MNVRREVYNIASRLGLIEHTFNDIIKNKRSSKYGPSLSSLVKAFFLLNPTSVEFVDEDRYRLYFYLETGTYIQKIPRSIFKEILNNQRRGIIIDVEPESVRDDALVRFQMLELD